MGTNEESMNSDTTEVPVTTTEESSAPIVNDGGVEDMTQTEQSEPEAPVVNTEPVVELSQEPQASDFDTRIAALKATGSQATQILIASLEKYIADMKPGKPMPETAGARNQYNLWKAISYVAETAPGDEFRRLWNLLLSYFEQYKDGVFHDRYVFRFSEQWMWSQYELNGLQRIINLIKLTSNQSTRSANLKKVVLDKTLAEGFSDDARQKIVTFYKG